jgi:hypothetical protein
MAWKEVKPNLWQPQEGDSIEGTFLRMLPKGNDTSARYFLEDKDNNEVLVWGSSVLDDRMLSVKTGDLIRITFEKTDKNKKGQPLKIYTVEIDKA